MNMKKASMVVLSILTVMTLTLNVSGATKDSKSQLSKHEVQYMMVEPGGS
ncbi:hypothetical protein BG08_5657 [Bacillus thuringiensis serovar kurstaki]|uniref:Response regulator aspartate phosphatase inhibitor n=1 Tax=Bacillus cereus ISP2954 TaxID=1053215 RepID=A0A9W5QLP6_BACCE|nr:MULTISPECIES: hypothetical protein [Bacillus cereus group]AJK39444.1 hypothetical protein BG08_5657 [Bacillus thuringiensis serovar kurstaki]EJV74305.1 hypothetical protein IG1_05490 [Bacillus cereus HD73]EOP45618.1 hypothetical protein IGG_05859 [Bacillus cereus HuB13-1]EOP73978.1 hypothetical protein IGU_05741 [Bacillus cereus ISP2954]EOP83057.1 hypothetical protein IES_06127 [Bacillus cereus BMG1.7]KKB29684.1 hypothetical protein Btm27_03333 [Bacillus thuringiensis serovar mexicanensis]